MLNIQSQFRCWKFFCCITDKNLFNRMNETTFLFLKIYNFSRCNAVFRENQSLSKAIKRNLQLCKGRNTTEYSPGMRKSPIKHQKKGDVASSPFFGIWWGTCAGLMGFMGFCPISQSSLTQICRCRLLAGFILESITKWMVCIGRDLIGHLAPALCHGQGTFPETSCLFPGVSTQGMH